MKTLFLLLTFLLIGCGSQEITVTKQHKNDASLSLVSGVLYAQCKDNKTASLTIDDHITDEMLDILAEANVKATFFVIGNKIDLSLVTRALNEGHTIGNHTYTHANLTLLSDNEMKAEINAADDTLGFTTKYMRPPWGAYNDAVLNSGKLMIGWADTGDRETFAAVSGIILVHEASRIKSVITTIQAASINFVTLDECL